MERLGVLVFGIEYHFPEPRDETGIAASDLFKKTKLCDGVFFDHHSIRELCDESTVSIHVNTRR